ncbi:hypothetical protein PDJAM_G00048970 [Pangasius djambal]|uniref:Uncharacterized protein n=1 Tax=Pangasius djambal TaxID=1691987 RepID=A0ACC5YUR9_9TELE|nr:hypothetical protein [Pangasius djambal]
MEGCSQVALKRMKSGKAGGPDNIPVEVWKCLGEAAVEFLTSLFNRVLESEKMPEEWRGSVLVSIFKNKGDVQSCSNYRGIKLLSHTVKLWERVVEARLRKVVEICQQQYGFMPRKSTTDAIFALRILMEKYRDGQRELHCVFVDLEKAYDRVPREELWYCMRKSGVAEKQKLRQALGGQVVLPDDWETTAEVIRVTGRKVLGVSSGRRKEDKETWWWNEEVQDSIQRKRLAKKKWDMDRTKENRQEYKELQRRVKREVSKAKQEAYDELYTRLDTREGQKDLYRLARQRDRDGKDVQQVRVLKDRDGRVLTSEESVQRRWKEYFEELMNEENEREKRVEGVTSVEQKVDKIRKDEVRKALKRMKSGKAVGPDDIPVEVVLPDDWETTAEVIRVTGRKVLGVSSGRRKEDKETWWWNEEVQDSIQRKRLAKKKWDMDKTEESRQEYKELQCRVKREVSKAKQEAYDELYTRLDTREGQKNLYRLARQRDRDGKDVQQVRVIKDRDGRVLTSEESVQRRWKEYFEELMNEENEREKKSRRGDLCETESR